MKTIIVTAYVPLSVRHRSVERYKELGAKLLNLGLPTVAFIDPAAGVQIPGNVIWQPASLNDCWYKKLLTPNVANPYGNDAKKDTLDYHSVQHEKTAWVARALQLTGADRAIWIDFGIFHMVQDGSNLQKLPPHTDDDFGRAILECVDRLERANDHKITMACIWPLSDAPINCQEPQWYCAGSVFVVPRALGDVFDADVRHAAQQHIAETNSATWEVNTWAQVMQKHSDKFNAYYCDHNITLFTKLQPAARGAIVMSDDRGYRDFIRGTVARNMTYAKQHGLDFRFYNLGKIQSPKGAQRAASWAKILCVADALRDYDWVCYIDSDAAFLDISRAIDATHSWFVCNWVGNGEFPCAGFFLIRRENAAWLKQWWEYDLPGNDLLHPWEQEALWDSTKEEKRLCAKFNSLILNEPTFVAQAGQWVRHIGRYEHNMRQQFVENAPECTFPEPISLSCTADTLMIDKNSTKIEKLWSAFSIETLSARPKLKIAVYALAKNEEKHAAAWAESCKEADYRVVTDTGSTDATPDILRAAGVNVHFGNVMPWRWDEAHNLSLHHVPSDADVCVRLDLDERFKPGWRKAIEDAWKPETTKLRYWYTWSMSEDGKALKKFPSDRVHSRSGYRWTGATHEGLVKWSGPEVFAWSDELEILHHRDAGKKHSTDLELLTVAAREMPHDARMHWYLARQMDYEGHADTKTTFEKYLDMPGGSATERAYACRVLARRVPDKKLYWLQRAVQESPGEPEGYYELARHFHEDKDSVAALYWASRAAACSPNSQSHASDFAAYSHLPADIAGVNAYLLGMHKEALRYTKIALERNPDDARLQRNITQLEEYIATH